MQSSRKSHIVFASILGNTLEFYNLTLYASLASIFANIYFPHADKTLSLLASLATFAAAFLVRPLGAILFGYIGDRLGRKKALGLSILYMGIPTLIIGVLPGYEILGIAAPIILVLCRLAQGLCAGGEFNGALVFALEHTEKNSPGFIGGLITGSCLLGSILATGIAALFTNNYFPIWGWRLAFFLGGIFSIFGYHIRKKLSESPAFTEIKSKNKVLKVPLKTVLSKHLSSFFLVLGVGAFDGILTYTLLGFLNVYLTTYLEISFHEAAYYNLAGLTTCMVSCPLFGRYADKYGAKETLVLSSILIFGLSIPVFMTLNAISWFSILFGHILLGLLVASIIGVQPLFSQRLFPAQDRYTGISFSYSLGVGVMGGLTPLILTMAVEYHSGLFTPSFYLMGTALAFLILLLFLPARK
jgi:MHS family proline/betaine transporter-like MFS transporter